LAGDCDGVVLGHVVDQDDPAHELMRDVVVRALQRLRGVVGRHDDDDASLRGFCGRRRNRRTIAGHIGPIVGRRLVRGPVSRGERDSLIYGRQRSGLLHTHSLPNHEHRHSGIGYHTPASVHFGTAAEIRASRDLVLASAYAAHPDRFVNGIPTPPLLPGPAWINKPKEEPAQIIR
jgi:hypothetical protein